jgi:uncharacterized membrane protein
MLTDPVALFAVLFALVALARRLESRLIVVQKIGSAVLCTLVGMALANVGLLPHASPVYEAVYEYAVPYAIVLVVLASNLGDLRRAGRPLVAAFLLAATGSFAGAVAAGWTFASRFGAETWKLAGQFAATFTGGSVNFVAVGRGLGTDPSLFAAAVVADNLSTVPWMLFQVALFRRLARHDRRAVAGVECDATDVPQLAVWFRAEVGLGDLAALGGLPLAILWVSAKLAALFPALPPVLVLTTLALALAQLPAIRRLRGAPMLSHFALHLFFLALGASSMLSELVRAGAPIALFVLSILAVHGVVTFLGGRLLDFELAELVVASQAAVGGPATALALSTSMRWPRLAAPGVFLGLFGYAVGNYVGFAAAWLVRALVG